MHTHHGDIIPFIFKIKRTTIDPLIGAQAYQGREVAGKLGLNATQTKQFVKIYLGLAKMPNILSGVRVETAAWDIQYLRTYNQKPTVV